MTSTPLPIFVITGQLAAGKSTVATALLDTYDLGFHVDVDGLREMVTSGLASPLASGGETERQFKLAIRASAQLAAIYNEAGFAVVIEGAIDPWQTMTMLEQFGLADLMVGIELFPTLEVALERNRLRDNKSFDTSVLEDAIRGIDRDLREKPPPSTFTQLDNSKESPAETAQRIRSLSDEKTIDF